MNLSDESELTYSCDDFHGACGEPKRDCFRFPATLFDVCS